ncbi:endonuclease/exonuclease/phosphatase family protein [Actibacterium sp. 188UL27-1]|uniref:endonuclease/exonuclease/phosphatase family protein n=1 Tax=Actibacterium sp. 188UL27-1 TaxID=2786961 RepID=UPI00195C01E8|nr:endonuclease/exonuclease/phosphatase family protein [Actibacterium sp. 188UL27-1]MBM7066493.1 endonuclease/exonuclease/phosphatase family protein [Actibacterium sp. 188UL27-1]
MTDLMIASFNVKNLIGADEEYYRFERYTPEEYAWKQDWLADQILTLNADVIGFQEIFDPKALQAVIREADLRGTALNDTVIPDRSKRYHRKAIFKRLAYGSYAKAGLAFAPNTNDGGPGERRPGLAILSRVGFVGKPEVIQTLPTPAVIPFDELGGGDPGAAGYYRVTRLSRPILKVRIPLGDHVVTVFNCHLKSKLGEFPRDEDQPFPPEANLLEYDATGRALGSVRAALRRMAEAWVLRRAIVRELEAGYPVIVLGDLNDNEASVSTEVIAGEAPFKNYSWMRRHGAERANDRYTDEEATQIRDSIEKVRLQSAERLFVRKSQRDMVYTTAFGGVFESIDQILLSCHFHPDNPEAIAYLEYFSVLNDHLTDGSHAEAPYNKLASDHGQIMAHLRLRDG